MHRWARGEFTEEELDEARKTAEGRKKWIEQGITFQPATPTFNSKEDMVAYAKENIRKQRELDEELNTPDYNLYGIVSAVLVVIIALYYMFFE